jgi:UDP-glucose 4-epimerase
VNAIVRAVDEAPGRFNVLNLEADEYCEVNHYIGWISEHLGLRPRLEYSGGDRGWIGDNPFIFLDCSRMRAFGWTLGQSIRESIVRTVEYLAANHWLLESRH